MTYPSFSVGEVLRATDMNAVGMWLVKSQAVGSGVSSVTVSDAFSADYDVYKIVYTGGTASGTQAMFLRLGASTAGYYGGLMVTNYATSAVTGGGVNNAAQWTFAGGGSTTGANLNVEISQPFAAKKTTIAGFYVFPNDSSGGQFVGYHDSATSYTAFTLLLSGTMTGGTIYVYGYKK